jgi:periplasmic protein TonB
MKTSSGVGGGWIALVGVATACAGVPSTPEAGPGPGLGLDARGGPPAVECRPATGDSVSGDGGHVPRRLSLAPDQPPEIINRVEITRVMAEEYRRLAVNGAVSGQAQVELLVGVDGGVREARVETSTGHVELDAAALRVAKVYRFRPGLKGGCPVEVWARFPIRFSARRPSPER